MAPSFSSSHRRSPLAGIFLPLVWVVFATGAEPNLTPPESYPALAVEMVVLELPEDAARRFALAERLADLGLVLSDAEATKLAEFNLSKPKAGDAAAALAQTWVGRSAVLRGSAGGRTVACIVLPEGASSEGDITLRVVPLPASRSPLEIAAEDHAAMFALSRTSATVQLKRGESMMFGGWKAGKDQASTVLAIVKPRVLESTTASVASARGSSMSTMRLDEARMEAAAKAGAGPNAAREVAAADSPAAAAASPGPVVQGPGPPRPSPAR